MTEPGDDVGWRPVVTDPATVAHIRTLLGEIVEAVTAAPIRDRPIAARADRAVLRTYLAQDGAVPDDDDQVGPLLAAMVEEASRGGHDPSLFEGVARASWAVAHLAGGPTADQVCRTIDASLLAHLGTGPWEGHYDLILGLVGLGVCGLERGGTDDGRRLAVRALELLEATARPVGAGVAWHTAPALLREPQRAAAPEGYYDLGVAHGNPGVVALLARLVTHDVEAARARALLDRAMAYLLGAEPPRARGRFPDHHPVAPGGRSPRLAWCYGDLGVSVALLSAAQATGDATWRAEALAVARDCAARSFAEAQIADAGVCHGAGGVAHLFDRLWHATGETVFADAARTWIDHVLRLRNGQPLAGFPAAEYHDGQPSWIADDALLTGATGVGLVLHAAISGVEPEWDRLLLADLASAPGPDVRA